MRSVILMFPNEGGYVLEYGNSLLDDIIRMSKKTTTKEKKAPRRPVSRARTHARARACTHARTILTGVLYDGELLKLIFDRRLTAKDS